MVPPAYVTNTLVFSNTLASTANTLASTAALQDEVLQAAAALQTWPAKLTFSLLGSTSPTDNILDYTGSIWRGQKLYFCPTKYPPNEDGFNSLRCDIQVAALANGSNFVSNGTRKSKSGNTARAYMFVCSHSKKYIQCPKRMVEKTSLRKTTSHNDRRNSRGKVGQSMSRRTSTAASMDAKKVCSCKFQLGGDDLGYYFCGGVGNSTHNFHYRIHEDSQKLPARLINYQEKAILQSIAFSNAGDGVGRNVCYERTNVLLSRSQIKFMHGLKSRIVHSDEGIDPAEDDIISCLRRRGVAFCCLYHHKEDVVPIEVVDGNVELTTSQLVNEVHEVGFSETLSGRLLLDQEEHKETHAFATEHRDKLLLTSNEDLLIALAFVNPKERRLFKLFPHVLKIDCTPGTNNEKRPLLTITGRDSLGKMFTVMRVFLPNERAWVFRWMFQEVLPLLLGITYLQRVQVMITDGDSQEFQQLDAAIAKFFPQTQRVRCGWHLVNRGWRGNAPGPDAAPRHCKKEWYAELKTLQFWIYSWMLPGYCEDEIEYRVSKALFVEYIQSEKVRPFIKI
jgi:hypothetical protein